MLGPIFHKKKFFFFFYRRVEGTRPEWYEYVLCGIIGAAQIAFPNTTPRGLTLAICGTIPPAAGLSSSSALVCAAALAFLHDNKVYR